MPHVFHADRAALGGYLERMGRKASAPLDYISESEWADFLADRLSWDAIEHAPRDGSTIEVLYEDGSAERDVYWAETRQCMLGSRAGERGPGWVSIEAGHLPVGEDPAITHFRLEQARRAAAS